MNLRFVIRDGKKILQYGEYREIFDHITSGDGVTMRIIPTGIKHVWKDIPLCDEDTGEEIKE